MPTKPAAVLFDLDGTLVDTAPDFLLAANALRKEHDLPALEEHEIANQVSNGSFAVTSRAMVIEAEHPDFQSLRNKLLDHYFNYLGKASKLYPDIERLLKALVAADIPCGIVTNKPAKFAEPLLETLKLNQYCSTLICPDHVTRAKPDPEPLFLAAQQLQVNAEECLYVGDHIRDIQAGNAASMKTIAVSYGYIEPDDNIHEWPYHFMVESSEALYAHFEPLFT